MEGGARNEIHGPAGRRPISIYSYVFNNRSVYSTVSIFSSFQGRGSHPGQRSIPGNGPSQAMAHLRQRPIRATVYINMQPYALMQNICHILFIAPLPCRLKTSGQAATAAFRGFPLPAIGIFT